MVEAATNKINTLLESFLGINDSELGECIAMSRPKLSPVLLTIRLARTYNNGDICTFSDDSGYQRAISRVALVVAVPVSPLLRVRFDNAVECCRITARERENAIED